MSRKAMIAQPDSTGPDGMSVQVEVTLPGRQRAREADHQTQPERSNDRGTPPRIPRITRLIALAIKFQDMVDSGEVRDYADLARLGYVTRARLTQIMNLLLLAPDIQSALLDPARHSTVTEHEARSIISKVEWSEQRLALSGLKDRQTRYHLDRVRRVRSIRFTDRHTEDLING